MEINFLVTILNKTKDRITYTNVRSEGVHEINNDIQKSRCRWFGRYDPNDRKEDS